LTKAFISWSGETSEAIAKALRNWLPNVLQAVKPYYSPDDIEKGTRWNSEISKSLAECEVGIICLTKNNLNKPWILFEAGALSKNISQSRVSAVLFGIESANISGPLSTFQNTKFEKPDFKKLVEMINKAGGDTALEGSTLDAVFEKWWPDLETDINQVLESAPVEKKTHTRSDRDLLEEILNLSRSLTKQAVLEDQSGKGAWYNWDPRNRNQLNALAAEYPSVNALRWYSSPDGSRGILNVDSDGNLVIERDSEENSPSARNDTKADDEPT
jgi:hypothetical protein